MSKRKKTAERNYVEVDKINWWQVFLGSLGFLAGLFIFIYTLFMVGVLIEFPVIHISSCMFGVLLIIGGIILIGDSKHERKYYVKKEEDC